MVRLWTIRVESSKHWHWVQFYAHAQRICPQTGNGLECGWRYARRRWAKEFEDFEKESVDSWHWVESRILTIEDVVGFFGSLLTEILNIAKCAARWVGSDCVVSIVRIMSLLVSKNWSQKLINAFVSEQQSPPVLCVCICICICLYLHLYIYCWDWF